MSAWAGVAGRGQERGVDAAAACSALLPGKPFEWLVLVCSAASSRGPRRHLGTVPADRWVEASHHLLAGADLAVDTVIGVAVQIDQGGARAVVADIHA